MNQTGFNSGIGSKQGRESAMSPQLIAYQELQAILNQGFKITDNRKSKADAEDAMHRSLDSFNKKNARAPGDVNLTLPPGFGLKVPKLVKNKSPTMQQDSTHSPNPAL